MRCPSCGFENPADSVECSKCGFPFSDNAFVRVCDACGKVNTPDATVCADCGVSLSAMNANPDLPRSQPAPDPGDPPAESPSAPMPPLVRPMRFRPRPRRVDPTSATLWIVFGGFAASVVLWIAIQSTLKKGGPPPIAGATTVLQAAADSLQNVLDRDSTNADARQRLADILYDTGNWEPAIVHYRAVLRHDPSRTTALVDLGVCYYNLSDTQTAETLFKQALEREPEHPVALFNLGIVHEKREEYDAALAYFRRSLATNPPEMMRTPVTASIDRVQAKMKRR